MRWPLAVATRHYLHLVDADLAFVLTSISSCYVGHSCHTGTEKEEMETRASVFPRVSMSPCLRVFRCRVSASFV